MFNNISLTISLTIWISLFYNCILFCLPRLCFIISKTKNRLQVKSFSRPDQFSKHFLLEMLYGNHVILKCQLLFFIDYQLSVDLTRRSLSPPLTLLTVMIMSAVHLTFKLHSTNFSMIITSNKTTFTFLSIRLIAYFGKLASKHHCLSKSVWGCT